MVSEMAPSESRYIGIDVSSESCKAVMQVVVAKGNGTGQMHFVSEISIVFC